jgi:calcium release-activated calcium channel protein 1
MLQSHRGGAPRIFDRYDGQVSTNRDALQSHVYTAQRKLDNIRRGIDDARRAVDEKAEQLKAISSLSALIAGFAMVAQTNLGIPSELDTTLLFFFGLTVASVVGLMMIAMLNATFVLIAIYKFNTDNEALDETKKIAKAFKDFWDQRCDKDWKLAFNAFSLGIPMFLMMLALTSWIDFWDHPDGYVGAAVVTAISIVTLAFWLLSSHQKWGQFLADDGT